jgi:hypothetical protein
VSDAEQSNGRELGARGESVRPGQLAFGDKVGAIAATHPLLHLVFSMPPLVEAVFTSNLILENITSTSKIHSKTSLLVVQKAQTSHNFPTRHQVRHSVAAS